MRKWFSLPTTATAPFCPSEVRGSVEISRAAPFGRRLFQFLGPGLLVSVGYMDPGNWATDIEAGSRFGNTLLFVVLLSSLVAMLLQGLSLRLGIVSGRDLAQLSRAHYGARANTMLWLLAELSIIACDLAEVLGAALALHLLFDVSLLWGIAITALDTLFVLGLKGQGFRQVEAIVLGLLATIAICFAIELALFKPDWLAVAQGFVPSFHRLEDPQALYLAIGVLGATVMPHNLYLHSSIVQTRRIGRDDDGLRQALRLSTIDTMSSLSLALLVNAAILILAASAFHSAGHQDVTELQDAYRLLEPAVGSSLAGILFGVALLAAGQSSTFTGTIAGQVILEGFRNLKLPCWQRRLITRGLALVPAFIGVAILGDSSIGKLIVASQVVLSLQLPFAIWPLIRFTSNPQVMGRFGIGRITKLLSWLVFAVIVAANTWLLSTILA
jgi:manganese transport protein